MSTHRRSGAEDPAWEQAHTRVALYCPPVDLVSEIGAILDLDSYREAELAAEG